MSDRSVILVESIVSGGAVSQITGSATFSAGNIYYFEWMVIDTRAVDTDSTYLQINNNTTAAQYRNTLWDTSNSNSNNSERIAILSGTTTVIQSGHGFIAIENSSPVVFSLNQVNRSGRHSQASSMWNNTETTITSFQVYKSSGNYIADGSYFRIWNSIQDTV